MRTPIGGLSRAREFSAVTRRGRRVVRPRVVVHVLRRVPPPSPGDPGLVCGSGVRLGLVVSKKVGNAVVRHHIARRLRGAMTVLAVDLPVGTDVVLRALPAVVGATSEDLRADVRHGLHRAGVLERA